jgi:hypothetical protein
MNKPISTIPKYTTVPPQSIGAEQTLACGHAVMVEHGMAGKEPGSPVVLQDGKIVQNGKTVGVFTTVDLCVAPADLVHSRPRD